MTTKYTFFIFCRYAWQVFLCKFSQISGLRLKWPSKIRIFQALIVDMLLVNSNKSGLRLTNVNNTVMRF